MEASQDVRMQVPHPAEKKKGKRQHMDKTT